MRGINRRRFGHSSIDETAARSGERRSPPPAARRQKTIEGGSCDDLICRSLDSGGVALTLFALDGLISSSDIGSFLLRPIAEGLLRGTARQQYAQARGGRLYNAVAEPVRDLQGAADKLVHGYCILLFPGAQALAFEVKSPVKRGPAPPEVENTVKGSGGTCAVRCCGCRASRSAGAAALR